MKKFFAVFLIIFVFLSAADYALAETDSVDLYFFYGDTCPHCKKAKVFLASLEKQYPELEIHAYEVFNNKENGQLLLKFFESCGEKQTIRVPAIFVGNEVIIGYLNDAITGGQIERAIQDCLKRECPNPLDKIEECDACQCQEGETCPCEVCACEDGEPEQIINYPIIGELDLSELSLPALTVAVGALDGFNPCAMWVLLFLLALLINVRSRKKIWLVGGAFILASGLVYYLLLAAWLNLFLAISYVGLVRTLIGVLAVGIGVWQLKGFAVYKPGVCRVAPAGSRLNKSLTERAKRVVESSALPATLIGVIILALAVNLVEFFCSAGLPAVYTHILSLANLTPLTYYFYLLLYTIVFMLDDMVVFAVALITLSKLGVGEKYAKWTMLIGGILILILGLLLIFRPELLTFG